jgi:CheY-like chemotaxis protein
MDPCTILVIEDDDLTREVIVQFLREHHNEVIATSGGAEALAYLARHPRPDFILLDLRMPGMDGWRVRDILAADPRLSAIPVVAMTATNGTHRGFADVLHKPFDIDRLLAVVSSRCGVASTACPAPAQSPAD